MAKRKAATPADAPTIEHVRANKVYGQLAGAKRDRAERLAETKRIFGDRVVAVDLHTHSNYSDGKGTIEQNREAALNAGLDFVFATDHKGRRHKRSALRFENMSWGQEPGSRGHHIGVLCNSETLKPKGEDFVEDFETAKSIAPFAWIPHPAGWYPRMKYTQEQLDILWRVGPEFAMEALNAAGKIESAYDSFDETAIAVWDRLLCDGRRVTPVGGSDAHVPEGIGTVWTVALDCDPAADSIIDALNAGRCQATEASLLDLRQDGHPMGAAVQVKKGEPVRFSFRAADAWGLQCVRIVSGGKARKTLYPRDETLVAGEWTIRPRSDTYVRLESRAVDNRRAFSAPIYLEVQG